MRSLTPRGAGTSHSNRPIELITQLAAMMIYAKFTELFEDWGFRARRGRGAIRLTHASTRLSSPRAFKPTW